MSALSSPSPRQRPTNQDEESQLPTGHCRYLLLMPELRGHRCGCTHFHLNRSTPNAICECGHLACFHLSREKSTAPSETQDAEILEQRLQFLEKEYADMQQFRREFTLWQERSNRSHDREQELVVRVSELEEGVEKARAEIGQEVREAYRNLGRAWDSITELEHYRKNADNHLRHINDHLRSVDAEVTRIGERQLELVDVNISLEERLDVCEDLDERVEALERRKCVELRDDGNASNQPRLTQRPMPSTDTAEVKLRPRIRSRSQSPLSLNRSTTPTPGTGSSTRRSPGRTAAIPPPLPPTSAPVLRPDALMRAGSVVSDGSTTGETWTVHISLLPTATQPFPFERDTPAYFRCLSRGLHRMVPVQDTTADAFEAAVGKAFKNFLGNNAWMPLQALPCTAERLAGLPMLRQLDPSLVSRRYDYSFLQRHCAVCDSNGKIESLYIAMRTKTISWHSLRKAPVVTEGLEISWNFDTLLDGPEREGSEDYDTSEDEAMGGTSRPSAGDIVATLPSLKRAASEMSRSSSFGSASAIMPVSMTSATSAAAATATTALEGEGSRPKVQRIYPLPNLVEVRRGVWTS